MFSDRGRQEHLLLSVFITERNGQWVNSIQRSKVLVASLLVRIQWTRDIVEAHSQAEQLSHELALRFARKVREDVCF